MNRLPESEETKQELLRGWWEIQGNFVSQYLDSISIPNTETYMENFFLSITETLKEKEYGRDEVEDMFQTALYESYGEGEV